jgi:hypothetical protein
MSIGISKIQAAIVLLLLISMISAFLSAICMHSYLYPFLSQSELII